MSGLYGAPALDAPSQQVRVPLARGARRPPPHAQRTAVPLARPHGGAIGAAGASFTAFVLGALALLLAGSALRLTTQAFFVGTTSQSANTFSTALVGLNAPVVTAFNVSNMVPGDFRSTTGQITNASGVDVSTFLTVWADTSSALDSNTSGVQLAVLRCGTVTAPVSCATATTFETVPGVMNGSSVQISTTSAGPPNTAGVSVSGTTLVFSSGGSSNVSTGGTIAGVPVLTKNNPGGSTRCGSTGEGGCALGGYSSVSVSSPAVSVTTSGKTISVPAVSGGNGLGTIAGTNTTDSLLIYAFLPSTAAEATFSGQSSSLSLAFTAVQPTGAVNPAR